MRPTSESALSAARSLDKGGRLEHSAGMRTTKWTRRRTVVSAAVVVALLATWFIVSRGSDAEAARWRIDPSFTPAPQSTEIPVLVEEAACASGKPATGRIELNVKYSDSEVTIDIRVRPLDGDHHTCQGVDTPYSVHLREPLGQRELVDANARTP